MLKKKSYLKKYLQILKDKLRVIQKEEDELINMNPIKNMDMWYNNLDKFRTIIKERYSIVLNSIQKEFNLTNSEYEKYFGDLK